MIISNLSHIESIYQEENSMIKGGGSISVGTFSTAIGEFAKAFNHTFAIVKQLPGGGDIGLGIGFTLALEYTPPISK